MCYKDEVIYLAHSVANWFPKKGGCQLIMYVFFIYSHINTQLGRPIWLIFDTFDKWWIQNG